MGLVTGGTLGTSQRLSYQSHTINDFEAQIYNTWESCKSSITFPLVFILIWQYFQHILPFTEVLKTAVCLRNPFMDKKIPKRQNVGFPNLTYPGDTQIL